MDLLYEGELIPPGTDSCRIRSIRTQLLLRASNSLQYRQGHEVFSAVTGPVEYGSDHAYESVNKLGLGNKKSSNEALTLQGWWEAAVL